MDTLHTIFCPSHTKSGGHALSTTWTHKGLQRTGLQSLLIILVCILCTNAFAHFSSWAQMHLRTLVDLRRRLRSTTFVLQIVVVRWPGKAIFDIARAQMHLRSGTKVRKWRRYLPGHTKFGGQGLPRTIANTWTHKGLNRTSNFSNNISMYTVCK
jgi:hypothetical protein